MSALGRGISSRVRRRLKEPWKDQGGEEGMREMAGTGEVWEGRTGGENSLALVRSALGGEKMKRERNERTGVSL